jgi:hypothetical protein
LKQDLNHLLMTFLYGVEERCVLNKVLNKAKTNQ